MDVRPFDRPISAAKSERPASNAVTLQFNEHVNFVSLYATPSVKYYEKQLCTNSKAAQSQREWLETTTMPGYRRKMAVY